MNRWQGCMVLLAALTVFWVVFLWLMIALAEMAR